MKDPYVLSDNEKENWNLFHFLLFHPAVLRPRFFKIRTYPFLPITSFTSFLLVHCVAIGSSTAAYVVTTDLSRTFKAKNKDGRITDTFEGSRGKSLVLVSKLYRVDPAYTRELHFLGGLQNIDKNFGPKIIAASKKQLCILYERLDVAEYGSFYNERKRRLNLTHFNSLLEQVIFMHQHGVIHQDIRAANVGFRDGKPVLMDFAFASYLPDSPLASPGIPAHYGAKGYHGTRETASNRILEILAADPTKTVIVTTKDDLISLFKLYYLTQAGPNFYSGAKNWGDLLHAWKTVHYMDELEEMTEKDLIIFLTKFFNKLPEGLLSAFLDSKGGKAPYARHLYARAKSVAGVGKPLGEAAQKDEQASDSDDDYNDDITAEVLPAQLNVNP